MSERLWQYGLKWLEDSINLQMPHRPLDERKIVWLLQDLHAVGERPSYESFKAFLGEQWPQAAGARQMARDIWRAILRNPEHRFRRLGRGYREWPLYGADLLIEEFGIGPSLEDRVDTVLRGAVDDFLAVAYLNPEVDAYKQARQAAEAALRNVRNVRRLRFGKAACGEWFFDDEPYGGGPVRPR